MRTNANRLLAGLGLALGLAACNKNEQSAFPLDVGYQPLEACEASLPAATATDPTPEALGAPVMGTRDGHNYAHGRAYVKASLAEVWAALQDPMTSYIHGPQVEVLPGDEPFPLSFQIKYTESEIIGLVQWTIAYRGGTTPATGTPESAGLRYQKIWGTHFVNVQSGSLAAVPAEAAPDVTEVSFVCWLDATGQQPSDAWGTVTDWFNDLVAKVHAPP